MGLQTQVVIAGHLTVEDICRRLRTGAGIETAAARPTHRPDYWVVEFADTKGRTRHIDLFLNSWAAEDYPGLVEGPSTMVSTQLADDSEALLRVIALPSRAWVRRHEQEAWVEVGAAESGAG
jgi:hypothetical protein